MCLNFRKAGVDDMNFISASYNMYHNSVDRLCAKCNGDGQST